MSERVVMVHEQRDGRIFVITYSETTDGHSIIDGLPIVLADSDDATALGAAVVRGLRNSTSGVLPARDLRENPPDKQFLEWVGAPSYAKYAKGVRSVEVWAEGSGDLGKVEITPYVNGGGRTGFTPMEDVHELQFSDEAALGALVQQAITEAKA